MKAPETSLHHHIHYTNMQFLNMMKVWGAIATSLLQEAFHDSIDVIILLFFMSISQKATCCQQDLMRENSSSTFFLGLGCWLHITSQDKALHSLWGDSLPCKKILDNHPHKILDNLVSKCHCRARKPVPFNLHLHWYFATPQHHSLIMSSVPLVTTCVH